MQKYNISGMSCAACSARVQKAVSSLRGVEECSVNLLTNSMTVKGDASQSDIISAVERAGYGASLSSDSGKNAEDMLKDTESPKLLRQLLWSVGFLAVLMYISMGHMMWSFPLPKFLAENHILLGVIQLLLTVIVMMINQKFFINGAKGILNLSPNMDTLVSLGSGAAFVYSSVILVLQIIAEAGGDDSAALSYSHEYYFESAAMILTLITVGKMLEAKSKGKTTNAIRALMDLAPATACVIRDGQEIEIPADELVLGDIFVVRAGQSIPADGVIIEGGSSVDESSLTGESIPIDKALGDEVSTATLNISGVIKCRATRVGDDTSLSQIIKTVSDAAAAKPRIAKVADKVSGIFVPVVIGISLLTFTVWLILKGDVGFSLARAISVLVISCPCALGLATPVAIMVGNGVSARHGVLFKTAAAIEDTGRAEIVVLDKTGTITKGAPEVTDVLCADGIEKQEFLSCVYSLEKNSIHPLASAINKYAEASDVSYFEISDFSEISGNGVTARFGDTVLRGGKLAFIEKQVKIPDKDKERVKALSEEGKTPLFFAKGSEYLGAVMVADTLKEDSREAIDELRSMGIRVIMLTGDNTKTAEAIGKIAGVDGVIADVLPNEKQEVVAKLSTLGKTVMVGDGINDAPALTRADIGIAIGAGTDVAIDAADVVLMKSKLSDVVSTIKLSRATLRNIHQNLFWAFFYNSVGIPVAAGVLYYPIGLLLNPMIGAAAMSLSSVCVVTNALRLNLFKPHKRKFKVAKTRQIEINIEEIRPEKQKEEEKMQIVLKIEGMMCPHCEARVKKCLEANGSIISAETSHVGGFAKVMTDGNITVEEIKAIIVDAGYEVLD